MEYNSVDQYGVKQYRVLYSRVDQYRVEQSGVDEHRGGHGRSPSHRNMSQTRSTEAQGSVREKAHMNHSVM